MPKQNVIDPIKITDLAAEWGVGMTYVKRLIKEGKFERIARGIVCRRAANKFRATTHPSYRINQAEVKARGGQKAAREAAAKKAGEPVKEIAPRVVDEAEAPADDFGPLMELRATKTEAAARLAQLKLGLQTGTMMMQRDARTSGRTLGATTRQQLAGAIHRLAPVLCLEPAQEARQRLIDAELDLIRAEIEGAAA